MSDPSASRYLFTVADQAQFQDNLFRGEFFKGHREPRIAMVGRSNVGKSSVINLLLAAKLAQTSNQPGKTRAMHFYLWKKASKIIVDLPGYGYAKAAKTERNRWEEFIRMYFEEDSNLERAVVLLDARHGPTDTDVNAIKFLSSRGIPVTFIFSKADTLKTQSLRASRQKEATQALKDLGVPTDSVVWCSSVTGLGLRELTQILTMKQPKDLPAEE
jgi:GTP-binding protein